MAVLSDSRRALTSFHEVFVKDSIVKEGLVETICI